MKISRIQIAFFLLIFATLACTSTFLVPVNPGASAVPSPSLLAFQTNVPESSSQPDLIIKFISLEMEGRQGNCVNAYSGYGILIRIENIGSANASPFAVDLNGNRQNVDNGLMAGQSVMLFFKGTTPSGSYKAIVDVTNQVMESREDNNTLSYIAPTPTPPLLCTPTPTATL